MYKSQSQKEQDATFKPLYQHPNNNNNIKQVGILYIIYTRYTRIYICFYIFGIPNVIYTTI